MLTSSPPATARGLRRAYSLVVEGFLKQADERADANWMTAQTFTLHHDWPSELTLVAPDPGVALERLPAEWHVIDGLRLDDAVIDHAVVGPNGVFTVTIDPDRTPATIRDDGLYRQGVRVTETVKSALAAAHDLRSRMGAEVFAYPLLVSTVEADRDHLGRLGVVPGHRIAEAIWSHPGRPMRRSQRLEAIWALRRLAP